MLTRNGKIFLITALVVILGAGAAYYFLIYKKSIVNTNVTI